MRNLSSFHNASLKTCLITWQKSINTQGENRGFKNRSCRKEWLQKWLFLYFSKTKDGVFCLACGLFPGSSHWIAKQLVTEPFHYWKDFHEDMENHSFNEYHMSSMVWLNEFIDAMKNTSNGIDIISDKNQERFNGNREILKSIIKYDSG